MKNLYVFYDSVSGNYSDVFSSENDLAMKRSAVRSLASVLPEIARDTVLLQVGFIYLDDSGSPVIKPCTPRTVLHGSSSDVAQMRDRLMEEAHRLSPSDGGDSCEE